MRTGDCDDDKSRVRHRIHRSAKRCLEILDELFGRDRRASDQILDQFGVLGRKGASRAELGASDKMRHAFQ
jgi:hypothetical protein